MTAFRDREKAIKSINALLAEKPFSWIVLSGSSKIGKTEFAREIVHINDATILYEPNHIDLYACALITAVLPDITALKNLICDYATQNTHAQELLNSFGLQYVHMLREDQVTLVLKRLIREDISSEQYTLAYFLGRNILTNIKCIFLDDFHRCDYESYGWILQFCRPAPHITVVTICNFDIHWESEKLLSLFRNILPPFSIDKFDSESAYFEILKDCFRFENEIYLQETAKQLFNLYDGSSRLLFETIQLSQTKMALSKDEDKVRHILELAQKIHLRQFDELTSTHLLILRLLASSPAPLTKECILDMTELVDPIATIIITKLYDDNFIAQDADKNTGKTLYCLRDEFLKEIIVGGTAKRERHFCETKIYRAIQKRSIHASQEQVLDLALRIGDDATLSLLLQIIDLPTDEISAEKKAIFINRFLIAAVSIPIELASFNVAKLLYDFGYYYSAERVIGAVIERKGQPTFEYLMLLGDIQHVLLSPKASQTYESAAAISGIGVSDRLKAINRQIMALNQEHQEGRAKRLYQQVLDKYGDSECIGLAELYRNTNNSFEYKEAMHYTIKGYFLSQRLGEELEMYKCLHNICMLRLQYGYYGKAFINNPLKFEPTFDQVLKFFSDKPEYRHEQAYPLLDLGTVQMFEYVLRDDQTYLNKAKRLYSEAQLYAKSFYAQHIAETGLLIVNSYQYATQDASFVTELRQKQYERYLLQKNDIADYRVHRKILLSLALSAIIGGNSQEATDYLRYVHPYIIGPETLRYNRLCKRAGCPSYQKDLVAMEGKYEVYYGSDKFVPWLISLCH